MHSKHLFVVRERDDFAIKTIYVYKAFTSEDKLLSYLKEKITYKDKDDSIWIVDVTCMLYNKELGCYELMSEWEYHKERDAWFWGVSGYNINLMFKLPIERRAEGFLEKWRNEE